jgi:hypothetical protein
VKKKSRRSRIADFSFRRFDHRNLAPPHEVASALECDEEQYGNETRRNNRCEQDQIPNCGSSVHWPILQAAGLQQPFREMNSRDRAAAAATKTRPPEGLPARQSK